MLFTLLRNKVSLNEEKEQAIIRAFLVLGIYLHNHFQMGENLVLIDNLDLLMVFYVPAIVLLSIWLFKEPELNKSRLILTCLADAICLTVFVHIHADFGIAFFPLYMWLIIANGFRFGTYYMKVSAGFNISLFFFNIHFSDLSPISIRIYYWVLVGMILLTIYVSALLTRLENSLEKEKNASSSKSQFLANMSHDIRTPLNGILGSNGLLQKTPLTFDQKLLTDNINYSGSILQDLIDNILDLTSIEGGREPTKNEQINIHKVLIGVSEVLGQAARDKSLYLVHEIDLDVEPYIISDKKIINRILMNLVGNAIKFTDMGGVKIRLEKSLLADGRDALLFEIIDSGIGVEESKLDMIFERFMQADNSDTRNHKGAGLGTAISELLIKQLGGDIGVKSKYGSGSTFWFKIPLRLATTFDESQVLSGMNVMLISGNQELIGRVNELIKDWRIHLRRASTKDQIKTIQKDAEVGDCIIHCVLIDEAMEKDIVQDLISIKAASIYSPNLIRLTSDTDERLHSLSEEGYIDYRINIDLPSSRYLFNAMHASSAWYITADDETVEHNLPINNKNYKILLAEDDEINQMIIQQELELVGYTVVAVKDGEQAVDKLTEEKFDLCIFDMQMPVLSGLEAIKMYRLINTSDNTPMLILTANTTLDTQHFCHENSIEKVLTKPVTGAELLHAVSSIVVDDFDIEHDKVKINLNNISDLISEKGSNIVPIKG